MLGKILNRNVSARGYYVYTRLYVGLAHFRDSTFDFQYFWGVSEIIIIFFSMNIFMDIFKGSSQS